MGWSVTVIGKPHRVVEELDNLSGSMTGQSKVEFDEAKIHIQALVRLTLGSDTLVKLNASGHTTFAPGGHKKCGICQVALEPFYAIM